MVEPRDSKIMSGCHLVYFSILKLFKLHLTNVSSLLLSSMICKGLTCTGIAGIPFDAFQETYWEWVGVCFSLQAANCTIACCTLKLNRQIHRSVHLVDDLSYLVSTQLSICMYQCCHLLFAGSQSLPFLKGLHVYR